MGRRLVNNDCEMHSYKIMDLRLGLRIPGSPTSKICGLELQVHTIRFDR